jgi:hypothetical protein
MIDKGIEKNLSRKNTERARFARAVYSWIKVFRYLSLILMIGLSFFEKPHWCMTNLETKDDP